jgi:hypothetical protein
MEDFKWVAFYNKITNERMAAITIEGLYDGEIEETKELLAYENNIQVSDINVVCE